jgi:hypothetical protein
MTAIGAAACLVSGYLYYRWRIGPFDPTELLTVTLNAISAGNEYAAANRTPVMTWLLREYHVLVPPTCVVVSAALMRRRLFENTAVSSVWWFGAAYTFLYAVYQFVFGRFVLETFYYFGHLTLVVYLLVPVILSELSSAVPVARRRILVVAGLALAIMPVVNRLAPARIASFDILAVHNPVIALILAGVGLFLVVAAGWLIHRGRGAVATTVVFVLLVQALTFLNTRHQYTFDSRQAPRERDVYLATTAMLKVFASYSKRHAPVRLWYCSREGSLASVASAVLLFTLHHQFEEGDASCAPRLGAYEQQRLSDPPAYVMMLDGTGVSFPARDASLRAAGFSPQEVLSQTIGGGSFHTKLRLVRLTRSPGALEADTRPGPPAEVLVDWPEDLVRQTGSVMAYTSSTTEPLTRDADGNWTFTPLTRLDHFATRWISVRPDPERAIVIDVVPSARATGTCVLYVQNQRFEDIGSVACNRNDAAQRIQATVALAVDVTSIRMYLRDERSRPIVLPRRITITRYGPERFDSKRGQE